MYPYAQTNIQLYGELRAAGLGEADWARVAASYRLAMELFSGRYRASGKPFVAHLVGTASILVRQGQSLDVVLAGMLHAAYATGDFGTLARGITPAKQEQVRRAAGAEVEAYVAAYTRLAWSQAVALAWQDALPPAAVFERQVLLIRLANELEDHLDLGMLYCGAGRDAPRDQAARQALVSLAGRLGQPALAAELARAFMEHAAEAATAGPRLGYTSSFVLPPRSCRPRLAVRALALAGRLARALRLRR